MVSSIRIRNYSSSFPTAPFVPFTTIELSFTFFILRTLFLYELPLLYCDPYNLLF